MRKFYKSIVFRGFLFFLLFALMLAASMIGTVLLVSKKDIEHNTFEKLVLIGEVMLENIDKQQAKVESYAISLAKIAETMGRQTHDNAVLLNAILDHPAIVSGGVWPLPYAYELPR